MIELKSSSQLGLMRRAGQIVAEVLARLREAVRPGISTLELDALAEAKIVRLGGQPAFKGYRGFPGSLCTSINEQVVHGIPSTRRLQSGDIVGLDVGAVVEGYYGDAAITVAVDGVDEGVAKLLTVTEQALSEGIAQVKPGNRLSDVSHAIQGCVERNSYSVVRDFVGHGIGTQLHEPPQIPNYGRAGFGPELKVGMVLAIEPMVNIGAPDVLLSADDGWTARTRDGSRSAHFEVCVAITEDGPQVLGEPVTVDSAIRA